MAKQTGNKVDRRSFLKAAGEVGLSSVFTLTKVKANQEQAQPAGAKGEEKKQEPQYQQVPKRKLGKTGVEVPCLSLGTNRPVDNQIILRVALQHGVSYWDTANSYNGGNSERTIGRLISRDTDIRKQLFIVTKASESRTAADLERNLQTSLERMSTGYIDLYHVHGLSDSAQLTDEVKQWVESAKKRKLINFFGFSTHQNMPQNLVAAAKLGWIDAIMTLYNFRVMQDSNMQAAVDTCYKAGVGLIAMKTIALSGQERRQIEQGRQIETEADKKLLRHFLEQGLTVEQAKIKYVLEDKRISSACVGMSDVANLKTNADAALGETKLTRADRSALEEYAQATCSDYCAGCANICNAALPDAPYVSDVLRYLMYYNSYGEHAEARRLFAQIPAGVRKRLLTMDYRLAESRCPRALPISQRITEAVGKLA